MSRYWKILFVIFSIIIVIGVARAIISIDNTADPSTEDIRQAEAEWLELSDTEESIVCAMWIKHKNTDPDEESAIDRMAQENDNSDEGVGMAKIDILERECD